MRLPRPLSIGLLLVILLSLFGCVGKSKKPADLVREAIRRTARLEKHYFYSETIGPQTVGIEGFVEDDVRYSAKISVNDAPAAEEMVRDDTIAIRYVDLAQLELLAAQSPDASASTIAALRSGAWVLDRKGAPVSLGWPSSSKKDEASRDPILESLKVLNFVDSAMQEAADVIVLNADSVSYRPDEDPFPVPPKDSDIVRYDLMRPELPKPGDSESANAPVPGANHFRKMSVYMKSGLIIEVREVIDVESRLADLARIYGVKFPPNRQPSELAAVAIDSVNAVRKGQGLDVIEVRSLIVKIVELGKKVTVQLPEVFFEGALAGVRN